MVMNIPNLDEWGSDNLLAVWFGERLSDGHFGGYDGLTAEDTGSFSAMRRFRGGINFPNPLGTPAVARLRGDGKTLRKFKRNADADNAFELEMALRDLRAETFFGGGQIFQLGYYRYLSNLTGGNTRNRDTMLLLHRAAGTVGDDSADGYEQVLIYSNKITPLGPTQVAQDTLGNNRLSGLSNEISITPWGISVEDAALFSTAMMAFWVTEFPDMIGSIVGDGIITAIPLDLPPVDDNVDRVLIVDFTASLGQEEPVYITPSAIDVDDEEIDLGAPLTDGHIYTYQWQFPPELL